MTAPPRRKLTKDETIATLVLQMKTGDGKPIVDRRAAQGMSAEQIIRAFRARVILAHGGAHATDGAMHPSNLWFTPRAEDALETPKDISRIAKGKRLQRRQAEFRRAVLAKGGQDHNAPPFPERPKFKRAWPSRPFPKRQERRA